jgi:mevalonate kinase
LHARENSNFIELNNQNENNIYPAKILIAGEFTVLQGGEALAIPLRKYYSRWVHKSIPDHRLESLIKPLSNLSILDIEKFTNDIRDGWQLESTIPMGYGLGSSGALSAAILDRYGKTNRGDQINEIKDTLASIENSFHGTSSGFDPLISYTNSGYLMVDKHLKAIQIDHALEESLSSFYLIDSSTPRNTITPIKWFYECLKQEKFHSMTLKLNALNEMFIHAILHLEKQATQEYFKMISSLQLDYFKPLITSNLIDHWKHGLVTDDYYLKLCGKGGGGFYLLYAHTPDKIKDIELPIIHVF